MKSLPWICCLLAVPLGWAADEPPARADPRELANRIMEKQRKSVAAMEASAERQRRAAAQYVYRPTGGSSLLLPPISMAPMPAPAAGNVDCPPLPGAHIDALISAAATREQVRPDLLRGIIKQESSFRPCAVSVKGAMGLMQLMPATAAQFGAADPFNAEQNVGAGARFLKELIGRYGGDLSLALAAYNAGPERVDAARGIPDIAETKDYVRKILSELPQPKQPE